jgi:hypothetical protein
VRYVTAIRYLDQSRSLDGGMRFAPELGLLSCDGLQGGRQTPSILFEF